jgi:hypothetical protein
LGRPNSKWWVQDCQPITTFHYFNQNCTIKSLKMIMLHGNVGNRLVSTILSQIWRKKILFLFSVLDFYNGRTFSKFSGGHYIKTNSRIWFGPVNSTLNFEDWDLTTGDVPITITITNLLLDTLVECLHLILLHLHF